MAVSFWTWRRPLNAAIDFVHALRLIGCGLILHHDDDGRSIVIIAGAASDRLDDLKRHWVGVLKAARRQKENPKA